MLRLAWPLVAAACLLGFEPAPARAQQPGSEAEPEAAEREAMARRLFQEGLELAEEESYAEAADRFRRAHELRPAPAIAFNWAAALVEQGELRRAAELLREVLDDPEAKPGLRELAEERLGQVQPRLGVLAVELAGASAGVRVTVDERELAAEVVGTAAPVDPGPHEVAARRGDEVVASQRVEVDEGGEAHVTLEVPEPEPEPLEVEPPEPEPSGGGIASQWWFWTAVGGVVVVGLTLGVVLSVTGGEPDPVPGNGEPAVLRWP